MAVVAASLVASACAGAPHAGHHLPLGAAAYWNRSRLLGARPFIGPQRHVPLRAHCINGGKGGHGYRSDVVFIPDYRDGQEPFGVWTTAKLLVAPQWANASDPDYDVGFVLLKQHDGENIEQVLGANRLGTDLTEQYLVHVTGYPDSSDAPITCINWTAGFSDTQLEFDCAGYTGGTSGSPWVIRFSPRSHTGTIVAVIGGYEEGGTNPGVSYGVRIGSAIQHLYQQAEAAS